MEEITATNPFEETTQSNQGVKWLLTHTWNIITNESWTKGRLSRGEYWISILTLSAISGLISLIVSQFGLIGMGFGMIIGLISSIRTIGMIIRRSHDLNQNGWYYFKPLIIMLATILGIFVLGFIISQQITNSIINWSLLMVILVAMVGFLIWMTLVLVKTRCYKGTIGDNMYGADRLPNQPTSNGIYWWIGIALAILSTIFSVLNPSQQLQNNTINQMIQQKMGGSMMPSSNDMMNQININTTQPVNQQIDNAIKLEDKSAITNASVTN